LAAHQILAIDAVSVNAQPYGAHQVLLWVLEPGSLVRLARALLREVLRRGDVHGEALGDAELAVVELATNAELYASGPYELRIVLAGGVPIWCEVADGGTDLGEVAAALERFRTADVPASDGIEDLVAHAALTEERGRGLLLVHHLSGGRCSVYPTRLLSTGTAGKAAAFALPMPTREKTREIAPHIAIP